MAVKDSNSYDFHDLPLPRGNLEFKVQSEAEIKKFILGFINKPPNIPRRRFIVARNQMLSLYRRMNYHPEKKVLCEF